ncbi:MAG: hypothetical protein BECKG1743D_GA0114223_105591 [Candidatus Kentron sp. G]|nr:MAG: hypothetical protein BECKG1743F_GA0114225_105241 [Candidatus Kentron sp. G]VFN02635.1 MAG: hypothetical protein BECKG1743E_GA0114224_105281 [Candidatus Kentron sp. G]VFN04206.1 MAG: hypothetical protein BECKG1743D_GA0114223_105591 [Candidatus Kentron sp. G]
MEILFNELSLAGQFSDQKDFVDKGLRPFLGVLKKMQGVSMLLLKKSDAWNQKVTPTVTLYSFLKGNALRKSDEVRRLKSAIIELTRKPFWDTDSRQDPNTSYFFRGEDIRGSSPAEACERDRIIVSFLSSPTSSDQGNRMIIFEGKRL